MKKVIFSLVVLGSIFAFANNDSSANQPADEKPVAEQPKLPRMPASDGSCAPGDVFNPTDGTCITNVQK